MSNNVSQELVPHDFFQKLNIYIIGYKSHSHQLQRRTIKMSSSSSSAAYSYQLNTYYGIRYQADITKVILDVLNSDSKYKPIAEDTPIKLGTGAGRSSIYSTQTSDHEDTPMCIIYIDEMTFDGPSSEYPEELSADHEPNEMIKRETKYKLGIDFLQDLYNAIVKKLRSEKISTKEVNFGWSTIVCEWSEEDDDAPQADKKKPVSGESVTKKKSKEDTKQDANEKPARKQTKKATA